MSLIVIINNDQTLTIQRDRIHRIIISSDAFELLSSIINGIVQDYTCEGDDANFLATYVLADGCELFVNSIGNENFDFTFRKSDIDFLELNMSEFNILQSYCTQFDSIQGCVVVKERLLQFAQDNMFRACDGCRNNKAPAEEHFCIQDPYNCIKNVLDCVDNPDNEFEIKYVPFDRIVYEPTFIEQLAEKARMQGHVICHPDFAYRRMRVNLLKEIKYETLMDWEILQ